MNEDAISKKIISAFLSGLISDDDERKKALEYINELPPVNHQETVTEFADRCRECGKMRKGHWIDTNSKSFEFHRIYKCSECGNTEIEYPENICRRFRYCPNCGCRMVEPQERSDKE